MSTILEWLYNNFYNEWNWDVKYIIKFIKDRGRRVHPGEEGE